MNGFISPFLRRLDNFKASNLQSCPPRIKLYTFIKSILQSMSTPKIIRVYSPSSKSQNTKETCPTQVPPERSSLDTVVISQKTSQMENYYSLLIDQIKRLSRDNDKMWKLLTQTQEQHSECKGLQKKLRQNLECAEKQLSMVKDMYSVEKSNYEQSKIFFDKRQQQWQEIVGQLKKVIEDYESTNNLDVARASEIFSQTTEMKSSNKIDKIPLFDKELSIYSKKNDKSKLKQQNKYNRFSDYDIQSHQNNDSNMQTDNIYYQQQGRKKQQRLQEEQLERNSSVMSSASRKNRSKLFKSKNFLNRNSEQFNSKSTNKICQKVYSKELTKLQYQPKNPQDTYEILTMQDIFERAVRKTYIKYRSSDQRARDILDSAHMEKLKIAKSSTKQRLNKTIRKVFAYDSPQQLEDVLKFIEDKVYKKYHLLKGELIFKFLQDKFRECEEVFQATNSALDRFDRQPTNFINGVAMNSKFRDFEQKRKQVRQNQSKNTIKFSQNRYGENRNSQSIGKNSFDTQSQSSSKNNSYMGLSINSNIKDKNLKLHFNNHMKNQYCGQSPQSHKIVPTQQSQLKRDNSRKNIYTEKRISRRNLVEQLSRNNQSISIQKDLEDKNLSSLIGASQEYDLTPGNISYKYANQSTRAGINNRTTEHSKI